MKIIQGEGFELKAEKKKVKATLVMIDPDLALLVLRFLDARGLDVPEHADEPPH